jgi:hypothetical protein
MSRHLALRALRAYQGALEGRAAAAAAADGGGGGLAALLAGAGAAAPAVWPAASAAAARGAPWRLAQLRGLAAPPPRGLPAAAALARGPAARRLHAPAFAAAQQLRQQAAAPRGDDKTEASGAKAASDASGAPPRAAPPALDIADAEECDEAIEDLEVAQRRVSALRSRPPGSVSLRARARALAAGTASVTRATLHFVVSTPGAVARFYARPRAERRACYARWWGVVKKEARHYWAGTKLLGKDVRIASRLVGRVLSGRALSR